MILLRVLEERMKKRERGGREKGWEMGVCSICMGTSILEFWSVRWREGGRGKRE